MTTQNSTNNQIVNNDFTVTNTTSGNATIVTGQHTSNASTSNSALFNAVVAGSSGGDPFFRSVIGSSRSYCEGADNTHTNDAWKLRTGANATVTPSSGGDSTLMIAEPAGSIRFPLNAAASVYLNTSLTNVTGDGTIVSPIIMESEIYDLQSNYNTGTGLFTNPIEGTYQVGCHITLTGIDAAHTFGELQIQVGGAGFRYLFNPANIADGNGNGTISWVVCSGASAATSSYISVTVTGGTKTVGISGESFGVFTGANYTLIN